jgi:oligoribonuclease NrnB/cAMP/cGMP phosphodiesterase (DHH superfamily)
MKDALCIYHGNCIDGLMAAGVVARSYPNVEFYAGVYGERPPFDKVADREVIIVDFSYSREDLISIADTADQVLVLDHHKTAQQALEDLDHPRIKVVFDMARSGAGITWDFVHPHATTIARPDIINYVEDRDLWRFKYPDSKLLHYALQMVEPTPQAFAKVIQFSIQSEDYFRKLIAKGHHIHDHFMSQIDTLKREQFLIMIHGHTIPVVNAPYIFASELAGALAEGAPFAATYFYNGKEEVWSLRSRDGVDVSEIAKDFGGGGHRNAAGFKVPKGTIV